MCDKPARSFEPFGVVPREDVVCPHCHSLERHRMIWLFCREFTDLFTAAPAAPRRVLHVAPEPCLEERLRGLPHVDYLTADLDAPGAMVRMDITDIRYPEGAFDVILCSHVLEHVPDDRAALAEFRRVLAPGGFAILNVPVLGARTFEDPSVIDPAERHRVFGQSDHVRVCGPDYGERIAEAGFQVAPWRCVDMAGEEGCTRMGMFEDDMLFHAVRPGEA